MKVDVMISKVLPAVKGKSAEGNEWTRQPIEVTWQEANRRRDGSLFAVEHSLVVELFGSAAVNFTIPEGAYVTIDLRFTTKEYNGRTFTNIGSNFIFIRSAE